MESLSQERLSDLDLAKIAHEIRVSKTMQSITISLTTGQELFDEVMSLRAERDRYKAALDKVEMDLNERYDMYYFAARHLKLDETLKIIKNAKRSC